jgi:hypothetical protein
MGDSITKNTSEKWFKMNKINYHTICSTLIRGQQTDGRASITLLCCVIAAEKEVKEGDGMEEGVVEDDGSIEESSNM